MCTTSPAVCALIAVVAWPAAEATAISRHKECRLSCGSAIDRCVQEGGRRRRCKRQTLRSCRRDGLDVCAAPTTSTSTTTPGATTSLLGAGTTTTEASTTSVVGASTTTTD